MAISQFAAQLFGVSFIMSVYRVVNASIYRRSGILSVEVEGSDNEAGLELEVEGQLEWTIHVRSCRIVYDENTVSKRRILVVDPPEFPIEELRGHRLFSKPSEAKMSEPESISLEPKSVTLK
jgi:hypothetical protein